MANILKLPFFKYSSKNFITKIPTKKLANIPIKNGKLKTKSLHLKIVAASTIGADSINEYFAVASLFTPNNLPVVIVMPDRDTPGMNAKLCDNPIINVCLKFKSL